MSDQQPELDPARSSTDPPAPSVEPPRDRRDDGRPEQARPRDRTGRPLPYGTSGVPLTEEHEPRDVEHALTLGVGLWGEQRYFEAHECLEHVWHAAPLEDADLWQSVIQIAVAGVHLQRGNPGGARALLVRSAERFAGYPDVHRGIDVVAAVARCQELVGALDDGALADTLDVGPFPAVPTGAWFTPDPAALAPPAGPTPLVDEPTWLTAGRPRRARARERD
ncbi:MAG: DUF309 domain-containing protein [Nitriliruptoraceae bacterium]